MTRGIGGRGVTARGGALRDRPSGALADARRASAALVTVIRTVEPAACSAWTTARSGMPKAKLTIGGATATARSTFAWK